MGRWRDGEEEGWGGERCKRKRGKGDKPWIVCARSICPVGRLIFQVSKE